MFDIIFLIIIVTFLVLGIIKGFMKELFPTLGLVGGYLVAGKYHIAYMHLVGQYVRNPAESKVITYIIILLLGFLLGIILDSIIFMIFKRGITSMKGRLVGAIFGFLKGVTVSLVIFYIVKGYIPAFSDELETSFIAPYLHQLWKVLHGTGLA